MSLTKATMQQLADIVAGNQKSEKDSAFSFARVARGLGNKYKGNHNHPDAQWIAKALTPASGGGAYLAPTYPSQNFIEILNQSGVLYAAGATQVPIDGMYKKTLAIETVRPDVWICLPNTSSPASTPNFSQVTFEQKEQRILCPVSDQLYRAAVPEIDTMFDKIFTEAIAANTDMAAFNGVANGPGTLESAADTTAAQSGSHFAYADLLEMLRVAASRDIPAPYSWFFNTEFFIEAVLSLKDSNNRPLFMENASQILADVEAKGFVCIPFMMGRAYISNRIPRFVQSWQSNIFLCNASKSIFIGSSPLALNVSEHFAFDQDLIYLRGVREFDIQYGPGIVKMGVLA